MWARFIAWIDRDAPSIFMQKQQLVAIAPLAVTFFWPGPGTPAMYAAFLFYVAVTAVICWRILVYVKRRHHVDTLIRRGMFRRFRQGRWLPVIHRNHK
jgi:O-antigen/teichoic acid export membrane protein